MADYKKLQQLNLRQNKIADFPMNVELLSLQQLLVSNNRLQTIPNSFCKFVNLKQLHLDSNAITEVQDDIGNIIYTDCA